MCRDGIQSPDFTSRKFYPKHQRLWTQHVQTRSLASAAGSSRRLDAAKVNCSLKNDGGIYSAACPSALFLRCLWLLETNARKRAFAVWCVCVAWSLFKAAGIMPGNKFFWIKTFRVHLAKKWKNMFLEKGLKWRMCDAVGWFPLRRMLDHMK